jgi:hypothetical protein
VIGWRILLVRVGAQLRREAVHQKYRRIIVFETAKQFIEQQLRGRDPFDSWTIEVAELLCLIEGQDSFEFFYCVHY